MVATYYLDTSIWLDLFEKRDEQNFPKGAWAQELVKKIPDFLTFLRSPSETKASPKTAVFDTSLGK